VNRRHYTNMTIDHHRAGAREWSTIHRSVAEFENAIFKTLKDGRRAGRSAADVCRRIPGTVKRVHKAFDRIQAGMGALQFRTLPGDAESAGCWLQAATWESAASVPQATGVSAVDQHITAARALGPAQPAVRRFLDIIRLRRHLPVRIMDDAIRVLHQVQFLRCQMEDLQFYSLTGRGIPWVNCWFGSFNDLDGGAVGSPDMGNTVLEVN
jgi:hypothetical protein